MKISLRSTGPACLWVARVFYRTGRKRRLRFVDISRIISADLASWWVSGGVLTARRKGAIPKKADVSCALVYNGGIPDRHNTPYQRPVSV